MNLEYLENEFLSAALIRRSLPVPWPNWCLRQLSMSNPVAFLESCWLLHGGFRGQTNCDPDDVIASGQATLHASGRIIYDDEPLSFYRLIEGRIDFEVGADNGRAWAAWLPGSSLEPALAEIPWGAGEVHSPWRRTSHWAGPHLNAHLALQISHVYDLVAALAWTQVGLAPLSGIEDAERHHVRIKGTSYDGSRIEHGPGSMGWSDIASALGGMSKAEQFELDFGSALDPSQLWFEPPDQVTIKAPFTPELQAFLELLADSADLIGWRVLERSLSNP